jgi:hypothetical protein
LPSEPRFEGPARRRAVRVLDDTAALFAGAGYETVDRRSALEARISGPSRMPLVLRLVPEGKVFGGTYALEITTANPVVEGSAGLTARGRGVVRMQGIRFRSRRGDEAGRSLAGRLEANERLTRRLAAVHFERIRVEPDGRAVIRHMGGSLVWILFPPVVKGIPLVAEQARASIAAMEAFAEAGRGAG